MKMKSKKLILYLIIPFMTLLSLNHAHAEETVIKNTADISPNVAKITYCFEKEIHLTSSFPPRIWVKRGPYSGYVYLEYFEKTRNDTLLGNYCGILIYGNFVPHKEMAV